MRFFSRSFFILQILAGTVLVQTATAQQLAPVINVGTPDAIPGQYIVVFQPGTSRDFVLAAQRTAGQLGGTIGFNYTSALLGFSARLSLDAVQVLRAAPGVAWIEQDQTGMLDTVQPHPPAGLDRVSERLLPLDDRYTYSETGTGVHAYVIDSGIRATHLDFNGRVSGGVDEVMDGHDTDDCYHHGTHVAGILGGEAFGIAKQVSLHPVRVADCTGLVLESRVIAGIDWVTANAVHPAVANISLHTALSPSVDMAVTSLINAGVVVVAATGKTTADACTLSPADVPAVISVGSIDPTNDTRQDISGIGTCVDLFAPGVNILSDWNTNDVASMIDSGTSMAAPHVAGVAARYLQNHPAATPADVWAAIHNADDVSTTPGWMGVVDPGPGSPNELLHWGSLNDGSNDGDPHIITVDGIHYDFQGSGEFVALRGSGGLQIQTRQTAVATTFNPGPNPYTGLATCVSLNTAVAALVGSHRVTFEPNLSGVPDPSGLQLRIDGVLTTMGKSGLSFRSGGRVVPSAGGGIEIDFPDGTALIVTPTWWASQGKWFLNVGVLHTPDSEGIMGAIVQGSWLPALPDGTSLGPMPASLHQRYLDLNQRFAGAWRVTDQTSLFDYAPGTSTATFILPGWPWENPPCNIPGYLPVTPLDQRTAESLCSPIDDRNMRANCVFDVMVLGDPSFAQAYALARRARTGR